MLTDRSMILFFLDADRISQKIACLVDKFPIWIKYLETGYFDEII
jgi:hypothetical protein